ncbi:MAG: TIGR01548 family HAD-type hydrolase [Cyanobacteria bacterium P01_H01_bin.15]
MQAIAIFDIDGVIRDVSRSYRLAIMDTVEQFTNSVYRPTMADIDQLKAEGIWNNDWHVSQELTLRHIKAQGGDRQQVELDYEQLVDYFQGRYRGTAFDGYIAQETLLIDPEYLADLTAQGISWGFFSGATRGSAEFVLCDRLQLTQPVLIAMEDAPEKPNCQGLLQAVIALETRPNFPPGLPVIYAGDTAADMQTIQNARQQFPSRRWLGVGILPPHVQQSPDKGDAYSQNLLDKGADIVLSGLRALTPIQITALLERDV